MFDAIIVNMSVRRDAKLSKLTEQLCITSCFFIFMSPPRFIVIVSTDINGQIVKKL